MEKEEEKKEEIISDSPATATKAKVQPSLQCFTCVEKEKEEEEGHR